MYTWLNGGLPMWLSGKEFSCQFRRCRRSRFKPWDGKIPWRRAWQPSPIVLSGKSQEQRSLVGYSPWGHKKVRHDWSDLAGIVGWIKYLQGNRTEGFSLRHDDVVIQSLRFKTEDELSYQHSDLCKQYKNSLSNWLSSTDISKTLN